MVAIKRYAPITELSNHAELEELAFHPEAVRAATKTRSMVSVSLEEHLGAKRPPALEVAKNVVPIRPHAHAPDPPPANASVGFVAGAVDRTRDAVQELLP